jgi:hypothetical protein
MFICGVAVYGGGRDAGGGTDKSPPPSVSCPFVEVWFELSISLRARYLFVGFFVYCFSQFTTFFFFASMASHVAARRALTVARVAPPVLLRRLPIGCPVHLEFARGVKTTASELRSGDLIEHGEGSDPIWRVVSQHFIRQGMGA